MNTDCNLSWLLDQQRFFFSVQRWWAAADVQCNKFGRSSYAPIQQGRGRVRHIRFVRSEAPKKGDRQVEISALRAAAPNKACYGTTVCTPIQMRFGRFGGSFVRVAETKRKGRMESRVRGDVKKAYGENTTARK